MLAFMSTMLLWHGAWTLIAAIPSLQSPAVALLAGLGGRLKNRMAAPETVSAEKKYGEHIERERQDKKKSMYCIVWLRNRKTSAVK